VGVAWLVADKDSRCPSVLGAAYLSRWGWNAPVLTMVELPANQAERLHEWLVELADNAAQMAPSCNLIEVRTSLSWLIRSVMLASCARTPYASALSSTNVPMRRSSSLCSGFWPALLRNTPISIRLVWPPDEALGSWMMNTCPDSVSRARYQRSPLALW
jgi:hypothetical protein